MKMNDEPKGLISRESEEAMEREWEEHGIIFDRNKNEVKHE